MRNNFKIEGDKVIIEARKKSFSQNSSIDLVNIDLEDFDKIAAFPGTWCSYIHQNTKNTYIRGYYWDPATKKHVQPLLHRLLISCPKGHIVSHKDGDTLNCCKYNLIVAPIGVSYKEIKEKVDNLKDILREEGWLNENGEVKTIEELQQETMQPVKGVSWHKKKEKWEAKATVDKKRYSIGYFEKDQVAEANAAVEEFKRLGPDEYYKKYGKR